MERVSTYEFLGIPDAVATAIVLVSLSIMLAPWFGGLELGPLKVPNLTDRPARLLRFATPFVFASAVAGFFPGWTIGDDLASIRQIDEFGRKLGLDEFALRSLENHFGGTTWEGGDSWGEVFFATNGREAKYTNAAGRTGGSM